MEKVLRNLKPQRVFEHFEALTRIPRESGNEKAVSDYLAKFAKDNHLDVIQDEAMNVIIKKSGSSGYEKSPVVILQGHMDMVCVKRDDLAFDFEKDPIPLVVEGDFIRTKGTTLGADNGIAVAMAMSILEDQTLEHPPLVALFTSAEETGMDGVVGLKSENISGDILINIDSEEEGTLLSSCAGGVNNIVTYTIGNCESKKNHGMQVIVQGLLGGHSGMEINKNRGNAIKILGRVLREMDEKLDYELAFISGGEKMNAIAKRAEAWIRIDKADAEQFQNIIEELNEIFKNEFILSDPSIEIVIKQGDVSQVVYDKKTKKDLIRILRLMPYGVQTMSSSIKGLVESSTNIGVLEIVEDKVKFTSSVRSSVRTLKHEINDRIKAICELTGAEMSLVADYPEWEYKVESKIRDLMIDVYREMFGKELKVDAIHAGLECGFLKEKIGDIDMISLGPNLYDVHTPNEHLSISSTERVYHFLCEVLKQLK
ncbi:dipeptidase D [Anaerosolibacter carboniphilus]|uniref:Cytosol non-specific dipeptidase n=1 Tax=Anaerosolibacter carboniphilus TaxID=1417629 RepID=A0A841KLS8_9FIRM|nr:dipeptidase D [Anaerosolibacter carboniphilus]